MNARFFYGCLSTSLLFFLLVHIATNHSVAATTSTHTTRDPNKATIKLKPFTAKSMAELRDNNQGKAFLVVFWSVTCGPCLEELGQWAQWQARFPTIQINLVNVDGLTEQTSIHQQLKRHRAVPTQQWVFAESYVERLRYQIDPRWRGELPRTYLFDQAHTMNALSGKLSEPFLEQWLRQHSSGQSTEQSTEQRLQPANMRSK